MNIRIVVGGYLFYLSSNTLENYFGLGQGTEDGVVCEVVVRVCDCLSLVKGFVRISEGRSESGWMVG